MKQRKPKEKFYFDYQATTPVDNEVLKAMLPFFKVNFGNPMSKHWAGEHTSKAIEDSRKTIAHLIGVHNDEVIFTSGATESVNLALKGLAFGLKEKGKHIITSNIEHKVILETCRYLNQNGFEISNLKVDNEGFINFNDLEKVIRPDTVLIAIGHANNEIGTIQNIKKISHAALKNNIHLFLDCAQSFGKIPINSEYFDSIAFSGHKIYGPMGIGGLVIKRKWKQYLKKSIYGGGQESGMRAGTHNVPAIVGLAAAAKTAWEQMEKDYSHTEELRDNCWDNLKKNIDDIELNGPTGRRRLPNNLNFSISTVASNMIVNQLGDQFAFSTGSACMSGENDPSHVILAIGKGYDKANSSFRISFGRYTTKNDVDQFSKVFIDTINRIKKISKF